MATIDASPSIPGPRRVEHPTDEALLARVMRVYKPDCRYLQTASVGVDEKGRTVASCTFGIPAPFYIDDTGHFNAVEFNLCYNQMLYYSVAKSVKEGLTPPFGSWSMDDYWSRQLPDFLIVDFHSTFSKGVRAQRFYGELTFERVRESAGGRNWSPMIVADTTCRYWDDHGGRCKGEVRAVVVNPPRIDRRTDADVVA